MQVTQWLEVSVDESLLVDVLEGGADWLGYAQGHECCVPCAPLYHTSRCSATSKRPRMKTRCEGLVDML
jgi:hypothetical protein